MLLLSLLGLAADIRVDVLDVGQGDSILIRTPANKVILIDAAEAGGKVVEQLRAEGIDHLDLVIATHPHADHIGGMQGVVEALPPKLYVDSGLAHTTQTYTNLMTSVETLGIGYKSAITGMVFKLDDGAQLQVLFPTVTPLTGTRSDLNSNSVVTRLINGEDCFLFTGDAEEPTERALLNAGLGQCDVLKVAHHGSEHSSTASFLNAVDPQIALVSCGEGNRYKHPGHETIARIRARGTAIYRTDESGRITLVSTGKGVRVSTERPPQAIPGTPAPWLPGGVSPPVALSAAHTTTAETLDGADAGERRSSEALATAVPLDPPKQGVPAPPTSPTEACPFPASASSEVFHEQGCGNADKISPSNRMCFTNRESALGAGRRPAGCCKP